MTPTKKNIFLEDMLCDLAACYLRRNRGTPTLCRALAALILLLPAAVDAQDASVDQLIKKLPPPEKVAKTDPASRDPLVKQILASAKAMNFGNAYAMSQKLASRYPQSAGAQSLHGQLSLALRRYSEAADAFHKAISLQPNFAFPYVGLGLTDAAQNRMPAAMSDFKQVTRLSPNTDVGWIGMSACAARMGHKGDSLNYAKQATTIAPRSVSAWLQLSRAETICGDQPAAAKALAHSNQLRRSQPTHSPGR
jgi:tetratricopeptide (TPR) repeat protein